MKKKTKNKLPSKQKISKRISSKKSQTKKISKRKNPILISDDETSISLTDIISHLDQETRDIIWDTLDGYANVLQIQNKDFIHPEELYVMLNKNIFWDYKDNPKIIKKIKDFQRELIDLPKNLEIEIPEELYYPKSNFTQKPSRSDELLQNLKFRHRKLY